MRDLPLEVDGQWVGNAVCYGPHRDGQRPGEASPGPDQLREDLRLMTPEWKLLRVYSASEFSPTLLGLIRDEGFDMRVVLGAWIAPDAPEANRQEIDAAIRLAGEYPDIVAAVCVGNETQVDWSAHRSSPDSLVSYLRRARGAVAQPVTTADDFNYWNKPESRQVAAEIDFVFMHAHPLWNGRQLEEGLDWLKEQLAVVRALHPDRPVVIGETGWATSVHDEGEQAELIKGKAGVEEQSIFYREVRAWADAERVSVFWFEAFDEKWKGGPHPNEVEKHWGLFGSDRVRKIP